MSPGMRVVYVVKSQGIEKIRFDLVDFLVSCRETRGFVIEVLVNLQNLKILHLHSFAEDTILEMLPTCCAKLEELSMIKSRITEKGLISLCQRENNGDETRSLNLRVIDLSGITQINDGVSYLLKNMPSLEIIVYQDLHLVLSNMYKLDVHKASEDKYNLTSFAIPYANTSNCSPRIQDVLCILSMCCPYIKVLSVPIETKQDLESISKLSELEDFSAVDISLTADLDLNWFLKQKGETLKRFKILKFRISVDTLIQNCPNLESLTLQYTCFHLSDPNINLKQLNYLYELYIKSIHYNGNSKQAVIDILNCSPKLENLAFFDCEFKHDDEFATKFTKYCEDSNLHVLTFNTCDLDMPWLQAILLTCSSLKTLVLDQCNGIDSNNIETLYKVSLSLKNKVEIIHKCAGIGFPIYDSDVSYNDMDFYRMFGLTLVNG
ncbi:uncharacterized protein TNIN_432631 [Trichonephila inaurata madagascariensis]|uniref:Uncharacterized protein n=1 Tax=Trichonephila inaurata madagascariensis TaxID=2747483 RepID=A0A8X6IBT2_9ARAC|nr:uncharacterized protein TNIN_432631 [Trichonephila inaurata madagascariensis]